MSIKEKLLKRKPKVKKPFEVIATSRGWEKVKDGVSVELLAGIKNLNKIIGDDNNDSVTKEKSTNTIKKKTPKKTPKKKVIKKTPKKKINTKK